MKMKQTIITILLALVAVAGQAQTPKDNCSIPKDSLCQERIAKSDTVNCPLDKLFLLKANVTNKEESKRNLPKIALPKNDIYREKFMNLQLINIVLFYESIAIYRLESRPRGIQTGSAIGAMVRADVDHRNRAGPSCGG